MTLGAAVHGLEPFRSCSTIPRSFATTWCVARNREPGQTLEQIAADFGISESCPANWMKTADVEDGTSRELPPPPEKTPELPGCPELLTAMRIRLRRLDNQIDTLTRSRGALAHHIDEAARIGGATYGPFGAAAPESTPA